MTRHVDAHERLRRFDRALEALEEASHRGPIVVEGPHDKAALRRMGITGEILVYNHQSGGILDLADRLRERAHAVLLFDWDRKGGHLARMMRDQLGHTIHLDSDIRREFARVAPVRCVEDLPHARVQLVERAGHPRHA